MACTVAAPEPMHQPEVAADHEPPPARAKDHKRRRPHLHDLLEKETKRMAQSLHDEAGQLLALVYLKLDELTASVPAAKLGSIGALREMLAELEGELRRLSHELRPMILDDFGLLPAVEFLRKGVTGRTGIPISVESNIRGRLTATVETALYRVTYEAFRMATQARARSVQVALLREESRVECSIRVEGGDSAYREAATIAMRQRIDDLSGTVLSCVTPSGNFVIVVGVPAE